MRTQFFKNILRPFLTKDISDLHRNTSQTSLSKISGVLQVSTVIVVVLYYQILSWVVVKEEAEDSERMEKIWKDQKGKLFGV